MDNPPQHQPVHSRNEQFAERLSSRIWQEIPAESNPYIARSRRCYGYDLHELMAKRSFVDVFYLLFRGELPAAAQAQLLEQLMIGLISPGPRHPAARAAMNAGVGKTSPAHILPIALGVLGGDYAGAGAVESAMHWLLEQVNQPLEACLPLAAAPGAGFGRQQGGVQLMALELGSRLTALVGAGEYLHFGHAISQALMVEDMGWLDTGVAAAAFLDLGFSPRAGACLFQLLGAPGLLAQGLEYAGKPLLAMPFVGDEQYVIED